MLKYSFALLSLLVHSPCFSQTCQSDFSFPEPTVNELNQLTLWATQYYIHSFTSSGNIPFRDEHGKPLDLSADTCDFCTAALEGTASITDEHGKIWILNYAAMAATAYVDCRKCNIYKNCKLNVEKWGKVQWVIAEGFGFGINEYKLIPYRTIAVDSTVIPYGTVLYIPDAKGKKLILPNQVEVIHDGYFFAGDTGGAIKQNHIDVFTGLFTGNPFPEVVQSNAAKIFRAYIVKDQDIIAELKVQHLRGE